MLVKYKSVSALVAKRENPIFLRAADAATLAPAVPSVRVADSRRARVVDKQRNVISPKIATYQHLLTVSSVISAFEHKSLLTVVTSDQQFRTFALQPLASLTELKTEFLRRQADSAELRKNPKLFGRYHDLTGSQVWGSRTSAVQSEGDFHGGFRPSG